MTKIVSQPAQEMAMKLKNGASVPNIKLNDINNQPFELSHLRGKKVLLTFYRFASCPFCNLRLHQIAGRYDEFNGMEHVAVFSASVDQISQHTSKHRDLFPILADPTDHYYQLIGVERSWIGMLKGMFGKMPMVLKSMWMGNLPREISGRMLIMPVDILINENGIVERVHYGKDEGDHIPLHEVLEFAN